MKRVPEENKPLQRFVIVNLFRKKSNTQKKTVLKKLVIDDNLKHIYTCLDTQHYYLPAQRSSNLTSPAIDASG